MNSKTPSENTECKVMVALATLNQMVNYIGIDHYKSIEKVFVIVDETVKDTKKSYIFNHNRWYKALEKAVNTQINENINPPAMLGRIE